MIHSHSLPRLLLLLSLALAALPFGTTHAAGTVYHVRSGAAGPDHDGAAWNTAFVSIQDALARAVAGDEIWVAAGTYTPASDTDRTATFSLVNGVALYGGFAGTETTRDERDWHAHVTVLSGEIGDPATTNDNSYHVVTTNGVNAETVLDGLTITAGAANGTSPDDRGGGMFNRNSAVTLTNITFSVNSATYGAGIYNERSSITIRDSVVLDNVASEAGGMFNKNSSPRLTGVFFGRNTATNTGGAMQNNGAPPPGTTAPPSTPLLINVVFSGNVASFGGAVDNGSSDPQFINVTFSGNHATYAQGGGSVMHNWASKPTLINTVVWGNTAPDMTLFVNLYGSVPVIRYSLIQGGANGIGNTASDPQLVDADGVDDVVGTPDDNLRLRQTSPAVDAGDNSALPAELTTDMDGLPRFVDQPFIANTGSGTSPIVDMGAYESTFTPIYVDSHARGANNGTSWATAYSSLQDALVAAEHGQGTVIYVAAGTYTPGATRTDSFHLPEGVALFGGFGGTEATFTQRSMATHPTILNGDIGMPGAMEDNSYHVVTNDATMSILDGFVITGGNANGSVFPGDSGGGVLLQGSSPLLRNIVFAGNRAVMGGGLYSRSSSPLLQNIVFTGNNAASGGGVYADHSQSQISNVTWSGNAAGAGGALFADPSSTNRVRNSIFWNNGANAIAGDVDLAWSIVQGGATGNAILDSNPAFVDPNGADGIAGTLDDNLHLRFKSPAIDIGDNTAILTDTYTDADGTPRVLDDPDVNPPGMEDGGRYPPISRPVVDLGAYERTPTAPTYTPTDLTAIPTSPSNVTVAWVDQSDDEISFIIERSTDDGAHWTTAGSVGVDSTTFIDRYRTCTIPYQYRVRAANRQGASAPSNTASATIIDCTLDSPASLSAAPASSTSIELHWNDTSSNETGFVIERSPDGAGSWAEISRVTTNVTTYTDANLVCGSPLFYRVASFNTSAVSGWSNIASTSVCPPSAPETLVATALSRMNVALTWNDASDNESAFVIERSLDGTLWTEIDRVPANETTYTSRGLVCATTYQYRVRAIHLGGTSPASNLATTTTAACVPQTIYVHSGATGANDGESWATAYTSLQNAVSAATNGDQIWVVAGTYLPGDGGSTPRSRTATFRLGEGVAVYGGFSGVETALDQRDWQKNVTMLNGAGAYHVVTSISVSTATILDGVTITGGSANGNTGQDSSCAGMNNDGGNLTIRNVIFTGNYATGVGGGMCNANGGRPTLDHVAFRYNTAWTGAGMANYQASPTLTSVVFGNNHATSESVGGGGGLSNTGGGSAVLIDVTFEDNTSKGRAGGIYNEGSTLSITRGAFQRNRATYGGAIFTSADASATISDTLIANNNAQNGAGIYTQQSHLDLHHTIFQGNAASLYGGGLYVQYTNDNITIHDVVFTNNQANTGGGAAFDGSSGAITSTTFVGNHAWFGSALDVFNGPIMLRNSIVWNNTTLQGPQVRGAQVSYSLVENGASGAGNSSADPRFVDADGTDDLLGTADDNLRLRAGSPAIDAGDNSALSDAVASDVGGSPRVVDDPSTPDSGSGMAPIIDMGAYEYQPDEALAMPTNLATTHILRSQITLQWTDQSDDETGFIVERSLDDAHTWTIIATVGPDVTTYTDRLLPCNTAYRYRVRATNERITSGADTPLAVTSSACVPTTIYVNQYMTTGGNHGESWNDAYTSLQDALVTAIAGDHIWVAEGTYIPGAQRTKSFVLPQGVQLYGGFTGTETALSQRDWRGHPTILSGDSGAADAADDNNYHVVTINGTRDIVIDGVTITHGNANDQSTDAAGGGIYAKNGQFSLHNVTVIHNEASRGGGIACDNSDLTIEATTLSDNHAVLGGGMYAVNACTVTITKSVFESNAVLVGNDPHPPDSGGGGLAGVGSNLMLDDVVFSANQARTTGVSTTIAGGGMLSFDGTLRMYDVTFTSNIAATGAGLANMTDHAQLQRITFRNNVATLKGGGFANASNDLQLSASTFIHNSASLGSGGGMYDHGANAALVNVQFVSNTAATGGGLCVSGGQPQVSNALFTNNAAVQGGAVYAVSASSATFSGVTFSSNSASEAGGAIHNYYTNSAVTIRNSILWGNLAPTGPEFFAPDPAGSTIQASIVAGGYVGDGNRDSTPLFVRDPAPGPDAIRGTADDDAGDLRLRAGSPAIDAGDNNAVLADSVDLDGDDDTHEPLPFDLAGARRFTDDPESGDSGQGSVPIIDMGAYEYQPPSSHAGNANLSVLLTSDTEHAQPGDTITLRVTVTNAGPDPARAVTVTTTLPEGLIVVEALPEVASGNADWACHADQAGQRFVCVRDMLPVGVAQEITFAAQVMTIHGHVTIRTEVTSLSNTTGGESATAVVPIIVGDNAVRLWMPMMQR